MAEFKDAKGRTWKLRAITVGDLDSLAEVGLDVEAIAANPELLEPLARKPRMFAKVLWWFVAEQVLATDMGTHGFYDGLDGDAIYRALVAISEVIVGFFPMPPEKREALLKNLRSGDGSETLPSTSRV